MNPIRPAGLDAAAWTAPATVSPIQRLLICEQLADFEFRPAFGLPPGGTYASEPLTTTAEASFTLVLPAQSSCFFVVKTTTTAPCETLMAGPFSLDDL